MLTILCKFATNKVFDAAQIMLWAGELTGYNTLQRAVVEKCLVAFVPNMDTIDAAGLIGTTEQACQQLERQRELAHRLIDVLDASLDVAASQEAQESLERAVHELFNGFPYPPHMGSHEEPVSH